MTILAAFKINLEDSRPCNRGSRRAWDLNEHYSVGSVVHYMRVVDPGISVRIELAGFSHIAKYSMSY